MTDECNINIDYLHKQLVKYRITWHDTLEKIGAIDNNNNINLNNIENENLRKFLKLMTTYQKNGNVSETDAIKIIENHISNPLIYSSILPSVNEIRLLSYNLFNNDEIIKENINKELTPDEKKHFINNLYKNFIMPYDIKNYIVTQCKKNQQDNVENITEKLIQQSNPYFLFNKISKDFCDLYIKTYDDYKKEIGTAYNVLYKVCKFIQWLNNKQRQLDYSIYPYYPNVDNLISNMFDINDNVSDNNINKIEKYLYNYFNNHEYDYVTYIQNVFDGRLKKTIENLNIDIENLKVDDTTGYVLINDNNHIKTLDIDKSNSIKLDISIQKVDNKYNYELSPVFNNIKKKEFFVIKTVTKLNVTDINDIYNLFKQALFNITYCYSDNKIPVFVDKLSSCLKIKKICNIINFYGVSFLDFNDNVNNLSYTTLIEFKKLIKGIIDLMIEKQTKEDGSIKYNVNDNLIKYYTYGEYNLYNLNINIDNIVKTIKDDNINNIIQFIIPSKNTVLVNKKEYIEQFFEHLITYYYNICDDNREGYKINDIVTKLYKNLLIKMYALDKIGYLEYFNTNSNNCDICMFLEDIKNKYISDQIYKEITNNLVFYFHFNNFNFETIDTNDNKYIDTNVKNKVETYKNMLEKGNGPCNKSVREFRQDINKTNEDVVEAYKTYINIDKINDSIIKVNDLINNLDDMSNDIKYINNDNKNNAIFDLIGLFCYTTTNYIKNTSEFTGILKYINTEKQKVNENEQKPVIYNTLFAYKIFDYAYRAKEYAISVSENIIEDEYNNKASKKLNELMTYLFYFYNISSTSGTADPISKKVQISKSNEITINYYEKIDYNNFINTWLSYEPNTTQDKIYTILPKIIADKYNNYFEEINVNKEYKCITTINYALLIINLIDDILYILATNYSVMTTDTINDICNIIITMFNIQKKDKSNPSDLVRAYFANYYNNNDNDNDNEKNIKKNINKNAEDILVDIDFHINSITYFYSQFLSHNDKFKCNYYVEIPKFNENVVDKEDIANIASNYNTIIENLNNHNNDIKLKDISDNNIKESILNYIINLYVNNISNSQIEELFNKNVKSVKQYITDLTNKRFGYICNIIKKSYVSLQSYKTDMDNILSNLHITKNLIDKRFDTSIEDMKRCIIYKPSLYNKKIYENNVIIISNFINGNITVYDIGPFFNILYNNGYNKDKDESIYCHNEYKTRSDTNDPLCKVNNIIFMNKIKIFLETNNSSACNSAFDFDGTIVNLTDKIKYIYTDLYNIYSEDPLIKYMNVKLHEIYNYIYSCKKYWGSSQQCINFSKFEKNVNDFKCIINKYLSNDNIVVVNNKTYYIQKYSEDELFNYLISFFLFNLDYSNRLYNFYDKHNKEYPINYFEYNDDIDEDNYIEKLKSGCNIIDETNVTNEGNPTNTQVIEVSVNSTIQNNQDYNKLFKQYLVKIGLQQVVKDNDLLLMMEKLYKFSYSFIQDIYNSENDVNIRNNILILVRRIYVNLNENESNINDKFVLINDIEKVKIVHDIYNDFNVYINEFIEKDYIEYEKSKLDNDKKNKISNIIKNRSNKISYIATMLIIYYAVVNQSNQNKTN